MREVQEGPGSGAPIRTRQGGKIIDLGSARGVEFEARAINERGQIVGASRTKSGWPHAFLWQDGRMTDLVGLGGESHEANAINERGQIVGCSQTKDQHDHAVLWTLKRG